MSTLTCNILFKGLTRPAMFWGVHSLYLLVILTVCLLSFVWLQLLSSFSPWLMLISPLLFGVLFGLGRFFCWREPHIFHLLGQYEFNATQNRRYYKGCNTYDPY